MTDPRPVAIVTGASGGIGVAITETLLAADWEIVAVGRRSERVAALVNGMTTEQGEHVQGIAADVTDPQDVETVASAAAERGPLELLVNCAGWAPAGDALATDPGIFDRCFRVNVRGTFLMSCAAARRMKRGARIINFASVAAERPLPARTVYGASKAAVVSLTRSLALEWAPRGIAVNAISPGVTLTPEVSRLLAEEAGALTVLGKATATGAYPRPEDIARAVVCLCMQPADLVTGQVLAIDAGWSLL